MYLMDLYSECKKNYQSSLTRKTNQFLKGEIFENGLHYEKENSMTTRSHENMTYIIHVKHDLHTIY